jgi:hypothetical protein
MSGEYKGQPIPADVPKPIRVSVGSKQTGDDGQYGYLAMVSYSDRSYHEVFFSANDETLPSPVFAGQYKIDAVVHDRCGLRLTPGFIRKFYGLKR